MEVGYFGAIVKSESFIEKLKQSSRIELTFTKPKSLLRILDIKSDYFNTEGFMLPGQIPQFYVNNIIISGFPYRIEKKINYLRNFLAEVVLG